VWDEANLRRFEASPWWPAPEDIDALFVCGDWVALPRPAAVRQWRLIGATAPLGARGRLITVIAEVVERQGTRRWRPIRAYYSYPKEVALWHERFESHEAQHRTRRLEAP
jgi:hypothetical protein